ncbi:MAG: EamA family transporter [Pseudomonadota bacterium]
MIAFLYIITVFIWGITWFAIKFQLGQVFPMWSVAYRFMLAALILMLYCRLTKKPLNYSLATHGRIAFQGSMMFCFNYLFFYFGTQYLVSGLVAVIFAMMTIFNLFLSRFILKTPLSWLMLCGAVMGIIGLVFIMDAEFNHLTINHILHTHMLLGFIYCLIATFIASCSNIVATINLKKLPVLQSNAYGMLYGAIIMALLAIFTGHKPSFDWQIDYVGSLAFLAVFGSVIAFGTYVTLIKKIGPEKAPYVFVLTPIIAMIVSTIFESFTWNILTLIGLVLVLLGNVLVMKAKAKNKMANYSAQLVKPNQTAKSIN